MARLFLTTVAAMCAVALASVSVAQTAGVQDGVKVGKAFVSGENPGIRLLDRENGTVLAAASFWRILWSPVGPGHVCYLTTGDGKSAGDLRVALVDNPKLHEYLVSQILGTFDKSYGERPFTVVPATFAKSGDLVKEWKETCRSNNNTYTIELVWRDFYEPFQLDTPVGGQRNPFGVTSFFIPAKVAQVIVNGKSLPGNVYPVARGPVQNSTAFLAFSESWVK